VCFSLFRCFLSSFQSLEKVPSGGDQDRQLAVAASNLFRSMEAAKDSQPPFSFLQRLHASYPQFAEKGQEGGLMQHDAEECWNAVLMSLARSVPRTNAAPGEVPTQEKSLVIKAET
jgi:hypothetical protein